MAEPGARWMSEDWGPLWSKGWPDPRCTRAYTIREEPGYLSVYMLEVDSTPPRTNPFPVMDSALWSHLSEELVYTILLFLPRSSQLRFRVVSKSWLSWLTAAEFEARSAALAFHSGRFLCGFQRPPYLSSTRWETFHAALSRSDPSLLIPDEKHSPWPARFKVHKLYIGFLPAEFQNFTCSNWNFGGLPTLPRGKTPCVVHVQDGLIVLSRNDCGENKLLVVNLLNETWKVVPPHPCSSHAYVLELALMPDDACGRRHFKLVVGDVGYHTVLKGIYCSQTDVWTPMDTRKEGVWGNLDPELSTMIDVRLSRLEVESYLSGHLLLRHPTETHSLDFQYQAREVDGAITIYIRRARREYPEACRERYLRTNTDYRPVSVVRTDVQTGRFEDIFMCEVRDWIPVMHQQRVGSTLFARVAICVSEGKVFVHLAYDIPLGSWRFLHAEVFLLLSSIMLHTFLKPDRSLRL